MTENEDNDAQRVSPTLAESLEPSVRVIIQAGAAAMGAALFGPVGAVLGPAFTELFASQAQLGRIREALSYVSVRLDVLEREASAARAESAARLLLSVARTVDPEKLKRLKLALVDRLSPDADAVWDSVLIDCVTVLGTLDVQVLAEIRERARDDELASALKVEKGLVRASLARLIRFGLLDDSAAQIWGGATSSTLVMPNELSRRFLAMLVERPPRSSEDSTT